MPENAATLRAMKEAMRVIDSYEVARRMVDSWPSEVELVRRLLLVMQHVSLHTRDEWASEYLAVRMAELQWPAELTRGDP